MKEGKPMAIDYEEAKTKIVEALTKKLKSKSKFYFNDLSKILEVKPREAKKIVNKLVEEGVLEYWSSGSTSMYGCRAPANRPRRSTKIKHCLRAF
jgi:Mn-dependent DtxR family transcriptional regulator